MKKLKTLLKRYFVDRLRGVTSVQALQKRGMIVGKNFWNGDNCVFDYSFCWLIEIGNDVTFASGVKLITHDASLQYTNHCTRLGMIIIEDNVYVGANVTILPGVIIGKNAIIGAGSLVNKNIPPNEVWGGVPAKRISSVKDFADKYEKMLSSEKYRKFDYRYTYQKGITDEMKQEMKKELAENKITFIE